MRAQQLFFHTSKEAPQDADILSHKLLERAGYIRRLGKGLYHYSPLMWRVLKKMMQIIREEMDREGCQEILMPLLQPQELWERSQRWADFKTAGLLYTLEDREGHGYCLSPTHEEAVVELVSNWVTSYKRLPINLYQIGMKFRDEIRPRFGLMRSKEFLMKDGYSFSQDPEEMEKQYQKMRRAYSAVFTRLGLDFAIVEAHGGKIGKGKSEEFQVKAEVGEDAILVAGDFAANVESAMAELPPFPYSEPEKAKELLATPNISTIRDLALFCAIPKERILKTVVYKLIFKEKSLIVAIGIRGDREVNETKVLSHFGAYEIVAATAEEIKQATGCGPGFAGPINTSIPYFGDRSIEPMRNFVSAANKEDEHLINLNWKRDLPLPPLFDFLTVEEGDLCPHNQLPYKKLRGIEVGHIFNLGTNYSEKLGALFQNAEGMMQPFWMGTYGIGVGRCAQAIIEQKHDDKGIIWPMSIAPFHCLISAVNVQDTFQQTKAEALYATLQQMGLDPLLDDRDERLGFKLKDSDLLGIPYKIIIGKTFAEEGLYEVESRLGEKMKLSLEELTKVLRITDTAHPGTFSPQTASV